jgi:hypothetical protein
VACGGSVPPRDPAIVLLLNDLAGQSSSGRGSSSTSTIPTSIYCPPPVCRQ